MSAFAPSVLGVAGVAGSVMSMEATEAVMRGGATDFAAEGGEVGEAELVGVFTRRAPDGGGGPGGAGTLCRGGAPGG